MCKKLEIISMSSFRRVVIILANFTNSFGIRISCLTTQLFQNCCIYREYILKLMHLLPYERIVFWLMVHESQKIWNLEKIAIIIRLYYFRSSLKVFKIFTKIREKSQIKILPSPLAKVTLNTKLSTLNNQIIIRGFN
jgi:hypothetical protein